MAIVVTSAMLALSARASDSASGNVTTPPAVQAPLPRRSVEGEGVRPGDRDREGAVCRRVALHQADGGLLAGDEPVRRRGRDDDRRRVGRPSDREGRTADRGRHVGRKAAGKQPLSQHVEQLRTARRLALLQPERLQQRFERRIGARSPPGSTAARSDRAIRTSLRSRPRRRTRPALGASAVKSAPALATCVAAATSAGNCVGSTVLCARSDAIVAASSGRTPVLFRTGVTTSAVTPVAVASAVTTITWTVASRSAVTVPPPVHAAFPAEPSSVKAAGPVTVMVKIPLAAVLPRHAGDENPVAGGQPDAASRCRWRWASRWRRR